MTVIGADGCPAGWFAVAVTDTGLEYDEYQVVSDLVVASPGEATFLLDVPIGLPETEVRECDVLARKMLGCRGASVFVTPCRSALAAESHEEAKAENLDAQDRSVSIQTWNIRGKIRDADGYLREHTDAPVIESHPEMCFFGLNDGAPLAYSKATEKGRDVRLAILEREHDGVRDVYESALAEYDRQDVARDDILDAIALAISGTKERSTIPADPPADAEGLPMRIQYPGPSYEAWAETDLPPGG